MALRLGADVIVSTDGDNQYAAESIPVLLQPILDGDAEIVVGDRSVGDLGHFSPGKRALSRFGSWVVGIAAGAPMPDAASGFRALTRHAALRVIVQSDFTYTHEMLIQAARRKMPLAHVPILARETKRQSRLARSTAAYVASSAATIFRAYATYGPLRVFTTLGILLSIPGLALGFRFLWFFFTNGGAGHVQSLLLCVLLLMVAAFAFLLGLLADVTAGNRRLLEEVLWRVRSLETATDRREFRRARSLGARSLRRRRKSHSGCRPLASR